MNISVDFSNSEFDENECIETNFGDKDNFLEVKKLFDDQISRINYNCPKFDNNPLIYGSNHTNSEIFNIDQEYYLKKSKLYEIAKDQISRSGKFNCVNGIKQMNFALNELSSLTTYHELIYIYPQHIMDIKYPNSCKNPRNEIFSYYQIEKINGITLNNYLESVNESNDNELFLILLQLIYVLIYTNINNYYHNDIKLDNIMVYDSVDIQTLTYNQIESIVMNFKCKKLFKIIDYSNSVKIDGGDKSIYLIDIYLLLKIINEKIIDTKKYFLFKSRALINLVLESIIPNNYNTYREYKLLDKEEIRLHGIIVRLNDIKKMFKKINKLKFPTYKIMLDKPTKASIYKTKYLNAKNQY